MQDLQIIKEYLRNKPGYLKCGNAVIQKVLLALYGEAFNFDAIRLAKKQVKQEFRNQVKSREELTDVSSKEPKFDVTPELLAQFNELAKKMGMKGLQAPVSQEDELQSILKRKKALRGFHTPEIKDQVGMHILMGCNHVPFHNKGLHDGVLNLIKDYKADVRGLHLLGDFLDLNPLSSHDRGKFTVIPGLTINDEYQVGSDLLYDFDNELEKDVWKTYLYGNHEHRYNRWMSVVDNAKTPITSPEDGLRLWQRGYNVKTSWDQDYITLGSDFDIFHGIYFSIHNAKAHLDRLRRSCAYVHTHRIQNYREGELAAYNIGTCADIKHRVFNYAARPMKAQWANGFAVVMIDAQGRVFLTQVYVDKFGHFYFGGKKY